MILHFTDTVTLRILVFGNEFIVQTYLETDLNQILILYKIKSTLHLVVSTIYMAMQRENDDPVAS